MSANILEKYAPRVADATKKPEEEALDNLGAFGLLRGVKERSIMLECRHANGNSNALSYALLSYASFDPSVGIILQFGGVKVRITGDHLNSEVRPNVRLYESLLRHRIPWIKEADRHELQSAIPGAVLIDGIDIEG